MAAQYVTDESGTYIPATQRPDGTWRKARRVKDGYVPQDEVPLYESKGKLWAKSKPEYPVGLAPDEIEELKARAKATIPGLNEPETKSSKKKKKKKKKASQSTEENVSVADITESLQDTKVDGLAKAASNSSVKEQQPSSADPAKRIRNLKKKLREIETLKQKIESGELASPEKEQLEKISRKSEIETEIEDLELLLDD